MSDKEPLLALQINGEEVIAHRWNTSLFTYIGELAAYNHIFVAQEDEEDGAQIGHYIFNSNDQFKTILQFIRTSYFPVHLNLIEVAECDVSAFEGHHYRDVRREDSFPESWME